MVSEKKNSSKHLPPARSYHDNCFMVTHEKQQHLRSTVIWITSRLFLFWNVGKPLSNSTEQVQSKVLRPGHGSHWSTHWRGFRRTTPPPCLKEFNSLRTVRKRPNKQAVPYFRQNSRLCRNQYSPHQSPVSFKAPCQNTPPSTHRSTTNHIHNKHLILSLQCNITWILLQKWKHFENPKTNPIQSSTH